MTHMPTLRPMGILEIVDQTFRLYRANFWLFWGIAAVVYVPLGLIQASSPHALILYGLLAPLAGLVTTGALTKAVSDRYMGEPASMGSSYGFIARRVVPFVLTLIVGYAFVLSGIVLLFVGMIVFAFWAAFITEVFVIEDKRYLSAVWRGRFLVGQGTWAEIVGLGIVTGIIAALIQAVPTSLAGALIGQHSPLWPVRGLITGLGQSLALPITLVSGILLYYDSRIRKEGFDLEVLARELGKQPPLPPSSPAPSAPAPGQRPEPPPPSGEEGA